MRQLRLALTRGVLAVSVASLASITVGAASEESGHVVSHAGGQVIVITGTDKKAVRIRSIRFR